MNIKTIIVSFSILPLIAAFFDSSFFKFVPVLIFNFPVFNKCSCQFKNI